MKRGSVLDIDRHIYDSGSAGNQLQGSRVRHLIEVFGIRSSPPTLRVLAGGSWATDDIERSRISNNQDCPLTLDIFLDTRITAEKLYLFYVVYIFSVTKIYLLHDACYVVFDLPTIT